MVSKGVRTFVIFDEGVYSGTQTGDQIAAVVRMSKRMHKPNPKIVVVAPLITKKALQRLEAIPDCTVEVHYSEIVPLLSDVLTKEQISKMEEEYGKDSYFGSVGLTYFLRPDFLSFPEEIAKLIKTPEKPYKIKGTHYYEQERLEYEKYKNGKEGIIQVLLKNRAQMMMGRMRGIISSAVSGGLNILGRSVKNGPSEYGGIDLTPANISLQVKTDSSPAAQNDDGMMSPGGIKFYLDPAMLQQLQNAPGFVPVIVNIKPMTDLKAFLGLKDSAEKLV